MGQCHSLFKLRRFRAKLGSLKGSIKFYQAVILCILLQSISVLCDQKFSLIFLRKKGEEWKEYLIIFIWMNMQTARQICPSSEQDLILNQEKATILSMDLSSNRSTTGNFMTSSPLFYLPCYIQKSSIISQIVFISSYHIAGFLYLLSNTVGLYPAFNVPAKTFRFGYIQEKVVKCGQNKSLIFFIF